MKREIFPGKIGLLANSYKAYLLELQLHSPVAADPGALLMSVVQTATTRMFLRHAEANYRKK